jgi:L,D-transpeptidase catalytic domain
VFALFGIGIAGVLAAAGCAESREIAADAALARQSITEWSEPAATASSPKPRKPSCYATAQVRHAATLYRKPGGEPWLRLGARTEWDSPRVLGVVRRKRGWLGVQAPELRNGEVGWLRPRHARLGCSAWSVHADLSKRTLVVRREGRMVRTMAVGIGRSESPTPRGRFTVTDKLRWNDPGSPYGCCVLALTGHQPNLPVSWPGGDRLAVHATPDLASVGRAVGLGCLRTLPRQARWLIETIPLGTPVFVRS